MPRSNNIDSQTTSIPTQPPLPSEEITSEQGEAEIRSQLYIYQQEVVKLDAKISETNKKIEQSRDKNIEALGLFVALFTFISIEFSLFREITNFSAAVSITLIAAALLLLFVLSLHLIIISSGNNSSWWIRAFYISLFLVVIALLLIGINFNNYFKKDYTIKYITTPSSASPSATLAP